MSTSDTERTPLLSNLERSQTSLHEQTDVYEHVIMVFGKTGSGVSSTVNTLLGRKACPAGSGLHSNTQEIQSETMSGGKILVIDMPDLVSMDNEYKSVEKSRDLLSSWRRVPPDAAFLVIRCDERYTEGQYKIYRGMREKLGDLIPSENLIIVFTHGKSLKKKIVQRASCELQWVLQDAKQRYVVLDNLDSDDDKKKNVCRLLNMGGICQNPSALDNIKDWIPDMKPNCKCSFPYCLVFVCFVLFIVAILSILVGSHIIILPSSFESN